MVTRTKLTGGTPITLEQAIDLRQSVFGSAAAPPRGEWTRTGLIFGQPSQELPYGLRCPRNATRGLQSVLQAFIIKYFLFDSRAMEKSLPLDVLLKPTEAQQHEALWRSISTILWMIGEKQHVKVVLPGEIPHIPHSHTYFQDSVTEKLYFFEFTNLEDLQIFIKRFLFFFLEDPGPGALLFLYSAVLTRSTAKVKTDLDAPKGAHLMGPYEEGSLNVVTLLLTGRATPYLHNGVVYVGDEDHYALPQFGILQRSSIGLIVWEGDNEAVQASSRQPGSRLKTPAIPVWVTSCCGHYGVVFNSNRELLRNYHAEKRFELHYYTCAGCHLSMTVDTRTHDDPDGMLQSQTSQASSGNNSGNNQNTQDIVATPLERLIHTKWMDAKITFHGPAPPSLNY
ncbi:Ubiquitin carboxyl-terminal hydrolase MINDY [Sergentomyia squamirostris]